MSGPSWEQVLRFDSGPLRRAAAAAGGLADRVAQHAREVVALLPPTQRAWEGPAARQATHRMRQLANTVDAGLLPLRGQQQALSDLADAGQRLRHHAHDLAARAAASGVWITPDGAVVTAGVDPEFAARAVSSIQHQVRDILTEAGRLDAEAARRLAEHTPPAPEWRHTHLPRPAIPAYGTDPTVVRRWWDNLDAAQRAFLPARHPDLIGALDGIPVAARDRANFTLLEHAREQVAAQLATLERRLADLRAQPAPPGGRRGEPRLVRELAQTAGLLSTLDLIARLRSRRSADGPQAYLIDFDTAGAGRVVLAIGDPDRADNVLTYVPGTGSALANSGRGIDRAETMAGDAAELDSSQDTATVYWLGYDAPGTLAEAARRDPARDAADTLRRFSDGLRASHSGGGARHTVLGHSYGSTVIGQAALDRLSADALVFIGSPGVVAQTATDLNIDADPSVHVWSSTAVGDWIHYARPTGAIGASGTLLMPEGQRATGLLPGRSMIHGTDPTSPSFGGQTFTSDPFRGHSGYWDDGNAARNHIARIAVGDAR